MCFIKFCINFVVVLLNKTDMTIKKKLPTRCPSCGGYTQVHSLHCNECGTTITGAYDIPPIMQLSAEEQTFISNFIKCSGSLKQMANDMGLSYPTVRNLLDDIINKLTKLENHEQSV